MASTNSSIVVPRPKFKNVVDVSISPGSMRFKTEYTTFKLPKGTEMVVRYDPANKNYSTMFILDHTNPEIQGFMGDPGIGGVVNEADVKVNPKDNTFTTKKRTAIYDKPGGKKIDELDAKVKHSYINYYTGDDDENNNDDEEVNYLNVRIGVKPSFFSKFNNYIADLLYENRDKAKTISKLTKREILARLKDPVYFPVNKDTKERVPLSEENKATVWIKCKYYQNDNKFVSEFTVPTGDPTNPKLLTRQELTGKIDPNKLSDPKYKVYGPTLIGTPTISFNEVYIKDEKTITLQWRVQGVVISKIIPKSSSRIRKDQMDDLNKISQEEINEIEKQLRLLNEENREDKSEETDEHANGTMQEVDMSTIIDNANTEDDNEIPGLPDLE